MWQGNPALGTERRLADRVRTLRAEAAPRPQEAPEDEGAGDQQPEERGVEECVDCEAGPDR